MSADDALLSFPIDEDLGDFDVNGITADGIAALAAIDAAHGAVKWMPDYFLDLTYGHAGGFWTKYRPAQLVTNDIRAIAQHAVDWTDTAQLYEAGWLGEFDAVAMDPAYKLNGTPTDSEQYGADEPATVKERKAKCLVGLNAAMDCVKPRGLVYYKTQNQVACNRFHDLEGDALEVARTRGFRYEGRLFIPHTPRPQRSQIRPRNNLSVLLILRRGRR